MQIFHTNLERSWHSIQFFLVKLITDSSSYISLVKITSSLLVNCALNRWCPTSGKGCTCSDKSAGIPTAQVMICTVSTKYWTAKIAPFWHRRVWQFLRFVCLYPLEYRTVQQRTALYHAIHSVPLPTPFFFQVCHFVPQECFTVHQEQ